MSKIDEKEELKNQAGMANVDGSSILEEMLEDMPDEEASQEVKDKNPFQFKYEVKMKRVPKKLKGVFNLKKGSVGRVIEVVDDKAVVVDFWDTKPARFPVKNTYLELVRTRKEVEIEAGVYEEPEKQPEVSAVKLDSGKPRMDLVRPEFMLELGRALEYGYRKYGEKVGESPNYLKGTGFHYTRIFGSLLRHIYAWFGGTSIDEESGVHHLALATANLMFLFTYDTSNKGIDDRVILNGKDSDN